MAGKAKGRPVSEIIEEALKAKSDMSSLEISRYIAKAQGKDPSAVKWPYSGQAIKAVKIKLGLVVSSKRKYTNNRGRCDHALLSECLQQNPALSYKEFKKLHPEQVLSDAYFYNLRKKLLRSPVSYEEGSEGKRSYTFRRKRLYYVISTLSVTKDSLKTVKELIQQLNDSGRTNLEIIELMDNTIEVREVHK